MFNNTFNSQKMFTTSKKIYNIFGNSKYLCLCGSAIDIYDIDTLEYKNTIEKVPYYNYHQFVSEDEIVIKTAEGKYCCYNISNGICTWKRKLSPGGAPQDKSMYACKNIIISSCLGYIYNEKYKLDHMERFFCIFDIDKDTLERYEYLYDIDNEKVLCGGEFISAENGSEAFYLVQNQLYRLTFPEITFKKINQCICGSVSHRGNYVYSRVADNDPRILILLNRETTNEVVYTDCINHETYVIDKCVADNNGEQKTIDFKYACFSENDHYIILVYKQGFRLYDTVSRKTMFSKTDIEGRFGVNIIGRKVFYNVKGSVYCIDLKNE